jgi:hypothetical protein
MPPPDFAEKILPIVRLSQRDKLLQLGSVGAFVRVKTRRENSRLNKYFAQQVAVFFPTHTGDSAETC